MKELHTWHIACHHTSEIIDRILMPIRKRGLKVTTLHYQRDTDTTATCVITFEEEAPVAEQIYKNLTRTLDVLRIERR